MSSFVCQFPTMLIIGFDFEVQEDASFEIGRLHEPDWEVTTVNMTIVYILSSSRYKSRSNRFCNSGINTVYDSSRRVGGWYFWAFI